MKKILLIGIIVVAFLFAFAGCGRRGDMLETTDKATAMATNMPTNNPTNNATQQPAQTHNPTQTIENIEPTNPDVKDKVEGAIESIVPDMESMMPGATAHPSATADSRRVSANQYTDDEIRTGIRQMAWEAGYTVYDVNNASRAMTDNQQTVDMALTLKNIREYDDMSSTRFVLKGERTSIVTGLEKVAECQTPLSSKSEEAIHNIRIANDILHGIILRPGEEFSFTFFLGEVSEAKGYKDASTFIITEDGEAKTEKGIGGGICQVASTLHGACLDAGMEIVERHPHSKAVSYITEGRDAAISIGYKDFKFVNAKSYPVVLSFRMENKTEIVEIYKM